MIFNLALLIGIFKSSYDNVLRWMPQNLTDDKSTLVQVMPWCRQATSHYLNQCWPRSLTPYGVTRPQWIKKFAQWIKWISKEIFQKASSSNLYSYMFPPCILSLLSIFYCRWPCFFSMKTNSHCSNGKCTWRTWSHLHNDDGLWCQKSELSGLGIS